MSANVFIIGTFREYQTAIKEILPDCNIYITDEYFRPWQNCVIPHANLAIVIADHSPHDRYGSEASWFLRVGKNIFLNSDKVMAIMDAREEEWNGYQAVLGDNVKIYCFSYTIDDDYNSKTVKRKINDYLTIHNKS